MKSLLLVCLAALCCTAIPAKKKEDKGVAVWFHKNDDMMKTFRDIVENSSTDPANRLEVKIAVYYEALCPDSKKFITEQLAPVWRDFRGSVKVKLVPYGKATTDRVDGKYQFQCHHGPDECYGNKVQSCILKDKKLADTEKVELVICLMNQPHPDKSLDTCLVQVKKEDESTKLKRCAGGEQGDNLLASFGEKSFAVQKPLSFVPTIVINEKFDQKTQDDAFSNLKSVVCAAAVEKPAMCA